MPAPVRWPAPDRWRIAEDLTALPDILDRTTEDLIEPVQGTDGPDG